MAAGIADEAEVQLAYAIGIADPVSIYVNTFGTGNVDNEKIERLLPEIFKLKPAGIIESLRLKRPIYKPTASYGHFGRAEFPWEKTDKVDELKSALK